jgi:hypothetical protein
MFENRTIRELIRKLASLRTWFSLADGKTGFSSQAAHRRLTDERGSRASRSGGGQSNANSKHRSHHCRVHAVSETTGRRRTDDG